MSSALRHYIPEVKLSHGESVGIISEERLEELTEVVKEWPRFSEIRHADVICFEEKPYRNTSCFFWTQRDGGKLIPFDDTDEYGNVPREFAVTDSSPEGRALSSTLGDADTEFHPRYWQSAVAHNGIFWLAPEIVERIKFTRHDDGSLRAQVKIGEKLWNCIVDGEPGVAEPDLKTAVFVAEDAYAFEGKYDYDTTFFVRQRW